MAEDTKNQYKFPPQTENENYFCTISSILEQVHRFGLPHFQRGSVWGTHAIGKLLESLTLDTPCGSIILWVPDDLSEKVQEYGDMVPAWRTENISDIQYLVVDGQQRLTSLAKVFYDSESTWGLNVVNIPGLREMLPPTVWNDITKEVRKRPLFDPIPKLPLNENGEPKEGPTLTKRKRERAYYIPLSRIREEKFKLDLFVQKGDSFHVSENETVPFTVPNEVYDKIASFIDKVKAIGNVPLQTVIKRTGASSGGSITDIIELYNRINSSGIVVKAEERVFASMVKTKHMKMSWLQEIFAAVHPENEQTRNDLLRRQRESNFGFKMFIQTFAQVLSHHMYKSKYDLSRIDKYIENVLHNEKLALDEVWPQLFEETKQIIVRIANTVREELKCDDYRFFSSAVGLRPIITLLVKYPDISTHNLAAAILVCQLPDDVKLYSNSKYKKEDDLLAAIVNSQSLRVAIECFPTINTKNIYPSLKNANSTQNVWMSLLYWLQRSQGAQDYSLTPGISIDKGAEAHKEHIVPFSHLRSAYSDLEQRNRTSRHPVNSIGNITFLSAKGNTEHGNEMIDLGQLVPEQQIAHQLDVSVLEEYNKIYKIIKEKESKDKPLAGKKQLYTKFRDARLQVLANQFSSWFNDKTIQTNNVEEMGMTPAKQLINPTETDVIREHNWPSEFKEAFITLFRHRIAKDGDYSKLYRVHPHTKVSYLIRLKFKVEHDPKITIGEHILKHHPDLERLRTLFTEDILDKEDNYKIFQLNREIDQTKYEEIIFRPDETTTITLWSHGNGNFDIDTSNSILFMEYMTTEISRLKDSEYQAKYQFDDQFSPVKDYLENQNRTDWKISRDGHRGWEQMERNVVLTEKKMPYCAIWRLYIKGERVGTYDLIFEYSSSKPEPIDLIGYHQEIIKEKLPQALEAHYKVEEFGTNFRKIGLFDLPISETSFNDLGLKAIAEILEILEDSMIAMSDNGLQG